MTAQELDLVQRVLDDSEATVGDLRGPHRRLVDAWRSSRPGPEISGDIAALITQVLRHSRGVTGQATTSLRLDLESRGIDILDLKKSNLVATRFGAAQHRVALGEPWAPEWLHGDPRWLDLACASPDMFVVPDGAHVSTYARPDAPVPADPAVTAIAPAIVDYRSRSQANAVRAAALCDPRRTLHVVLPTGTGKSLVGLAPGLLTSGGTTVVVVPTVALALDQERGLRARFPHVALPFELAYYGDRPEGERAAIKERLRNGTQRVLFTSPEALVTGLAGAMRELATRGGLTHLVIDEAHLVRSWGLSFRPDFQIVASLVDELRDLARAAERPPPRVSLLTATLSAQALVLNDNLFGGSEDSLFVGSTFLRTELRYLTAETADPVTRLARVVEALRHLPRPAIVYTTRKDTAQEIEDGLRAHGFGRTAVFTGDVDSSRRLDILRKWSGDGEATSYDVVVGTSAFGLGVDQADVRSVVHACIPATVDRFYQEVGRAGRDGHAAVSVWIPATVDKAQSRIEKATVLGDDKAWKRWNAMRQHHVPLGADPRRMVLDSAVVPPHMDMDSDKNRLWNRNTLVLMQRAGLLDIENLDPPKVPQDPDESRESWAARVAEAWEEYVSLIGVRVREHVNNLDEASVAGALATARAEIKASETASSDRMNRLLARQECWGKVLAEEYGYVNVGHMHATQTVSPACSGCPASEHAHQSTYFAALPVVAEGLLPDLGLRTSAGLIELAIGGRTIVVTYPPDQLRSSLPQLMQTTVNNGIRGVLGSPSLVGLKPVRSAAKYASPGLITVDAIAAGQVPIPLPVPTLILLDGHDAPRRSWLEATEGPLRIVVLPETTHDPVYSSDLVKNVRSPHFGLADFLRRL